MPTEKQKQKSKQPRKFWDKQPVIPLTEKILEDGEVDVRENLTTNYIRDAPYKLPTGFKWDLIDTSCTAQLTELHVFLKKYYNRGVTRGYTKEYSIETLRWGLQPPGYFPDWHICIRQESNNKLLATITGIPMKIKFREKEIMVCNINFLCVHPKLRTKRLSPVLIKEVTRRIFLRDIWHGIATGSVPVFSPVSTLSQYCRPLNLEKIYELGYVPTHKNTSLKLFKKVYSLPPITECTRNLVPLGKKHIQSAFHLFTEYVKQFELAPILTEKEFEHWFMPRKGVNHTFVLENEKGEVTDLCSYHDIAFNIHGHYKYDELKSVYLHYSISKTVDAKTLSSLWMSIAKQQGFDLVEGFDNMKNKEIFDCMNFVKGGSSLYLYMYNWKCRPLETGQIGFFIL